jgi:hypothetical protein
MSQVAYFFAQDGLSQKMRHERTVPIEVLAGVAVEHGVVPLGRKGTGIFFGFKVLSDARPFQTEK